MNASVQLLATSAEHPFPGLRPFAYQDHAFFFGRDDQTFALYRLIDRSRFIAVVGSSGSGKSSLVRAGLLPLLDEETSGAGGRSWLWREMRPGDAPLQRLANLLASLSDDDDPAIASGRRERVAAQLQRSSFGISEALADARGLTGKTLVLVVDQFEELFRYAAAGAARIHVTADDAQARDEAAQFVQLLLEASRAPLQKIHVVLTMRSDFIGDCARFHGLPEAVCAAQFLVPSLTRDQLDEVIRRPVGQAGATINPELVERLLNDCGTDLDQLPVLQHCLSRLWEEAGKPQAEAPQHAGGRHLSLVHYRNIGEFSGALSRHANEILGDLGPKLELAVTQIFSALSELDKEGRAIRRALRFSQLVAETGVDEADVRRVLDRFRGDDCSFVIPPRVEVKWLEPNTRIDVGHEALLRRWEKVSGHGLELGWLRAEQQAGERYRGLLVMADSGAALPAHLVDERLAWWRARPRTAAWAERYGGGFERVVRLLDVSRRQQRLKQWSFVATLVSAIVLAVVMGSLWQSARNAQKEADESRKSALTTTRTSIGRLGGFVNDGTLSARNAELLLEDAKLTLEDLARNENQSAEIAEIEILLLLSFSDVRVTLGDHADALRRAERALAIAERLLRSNPGDERLMRHVYAASFRIGDEKALAGDNAEAERQYTRALSHARRRESLKPEDMQRKRDIAFILNKLADIERAKGNPTTALGYYNDGLKVAEAVAGKFPIDRATQKNRIAQLLSERKDIAGALVQYREALAIQMDLLRTTPDDATLLSNAATTRRRIGLLLKDEPNAALPELQAAVAYRKKLFEGDPSSVTWRTGLAFDQKLLGDILFALEDYRGAAQAYAAASQIEEGLVLKDPANLGWQRNLAATNIKRGDLLIARAEARENPEPAVDDNTRRSRDALARYQRAAEISERLLPQRAAGADRFANLFKARIKVGDTQARLLDHAAALNTYQAALAVVASAPPTEPIAAWYVEVADSIREACEFMEKGPSAAALAGKDHSDALVCYRKALAAIEAAAAKAPDNVDVREKTAALSMKVQALQPAAK